MMVKSSVKHCILWCWIFGYSTLAAWLILLAVVEAWPNLIEPLGLERFRFLALKLRDMSDDKLVFTYRPNITLKFKDFAGDEYSPVYGPPPEMFGGGEIAYDDNGFPRRELSQRYDDKHSITLVGDSFVEAGSVSHDTVADLLEPKVRQRVLNLGMPGYGPAQYLVVLKRFGLDQQSSNVFVFFFEGNDLSDSTQYLNWKNGGDYYADKRRSYFTRYYDTLRQSVLFILDHIKSLTRFTIAGDPTNSGESVSDIRANEIHPDLALVNLAGSDIKMILRYRAEKKSPVQIVNSEEGRLIMSTFSELHGLAESKSFKAYVVYIPSKTHIYAKYAQKGGDNWLQRRDGELKNKNNLEQAVAIAADRAGLSFVSLTPVFEQEAAKGHLLYHPFDSHWNSAGRSVAATLLASLVADSPDWSSKR
jgi:hypothetical protein